MFSSVNRNLFSISTEIDRKGYLFSLCSDVIVSETCHGQPMHCGRVVWMLILNCLLACQACQVREKGVLENNSLFKNESI